MRHLYQRAKVVIFILVLRIHEGVRLDRAMGRWLEVLREGRPGLRRGEVKVGHGVADHDDLGVASFLGLDGVLAPGALRPTSVGGAGLMRQA